MSAPPRQWVIPPMTGTRLTANDRPHWAQRARATAEWRGLACGWAKSLRIPRLARAHILAEWLPYDRRDRDPANAYPMVKACVDGIAIDAGVLVDDSARYLDGPDMRLGAVWRLTPGHGLATLRITITEVPA